MGLVGAAGWAVVAEPGLADAAVWVTPGWVGLVSGGGCVTAGLGAGGRALFVWVGLAGAEGRAVAAGPGWAVVAGPGLVGAAVWAPFVWVGLAGADGGAVAVGLGLVGAGVLAALGWAGLVGAAGGVFARPGLVGAGWAPPGWAGLVGAGRVTAGLGLIKAAAACLFAGPGLGGSRPERRLAGLVWLARPVDPLPGWV